MNIELSPSQERRLHLILDKGLVSLNENSLIQDSCQVLKEDLDLTFSSSASKTSNFSKASKNSHHSFGKLLDLQDSSNKKNDQELSELNLLKEKLADLESKIQKKPGKVLKSKENESQRPCLIKNCRKILSSRPISAIKRKTSTKLQETSENRSNSKIRSLKKIETSEKMIKKLERSITTSPTLKNSLNSCKNIEKIPGSFENERKISETLRKENDSLRKELKSQVDLSTKLQKLQEDYKNLSTSFEKSEQIRKKQKNLIEQLKSEILSSEASRLKRRH
jgi:hypothetical protein